MIVPCWDTANIIKTAGGTFYFLEFHLKYLGAGNINDSADSLPAPHKSEVIGMDNKFLILFFSPPSRLGRPCIVGINILFRYLRPEYRGEEVHCVFLRDVHHDFMVRVR